MPADIRFPLERANGVQIVKTAAALGAAGARTTLLVRQSDPRPDGRDPRPVRRGAASLPARAPPAASSTAAARSRCPARPSWPAPPWPRCPPCAAARWCSRAISSSRTCWSALPGAPRVVYEAHAVEALMYAERAPPLRHRGEDAIRASEARLQARERRVWRGAAAVVTTTAGIRDSFAGAYGERPRVHVVPNGCDPPDARVRRPSRGRAGGPLRGPALSLEGRGRAGGGLRARPARAPGDPRRHRGRARHRARARPRRAPRTGRARGHARPRAAGARGGRAAARDGGRGAVPAHGDDRAAHLAPQGLRGDGGGAGHRRLRPAFDARGAAPRAHRLAGPPR